MTQTALELDATSASIGRAHEMVKNFRLRPEVAEVWAQPTEGDALSFAYTEIGEAAAEQAGMFVALMLNSRDNFGRDQERFNLTIATREASVALDARMREDQRYARNNKRMIDLHEELTDHAIMLLSSMPTVANMESLLKAMFRTTTDPYAGLRAMEPVLSLCAAMGSILESWLDGSPQWRTKVAYQLRFLFEYVPELEALIEKKLEKLYNKHVLGQTQV